MEEKLENAERIRKELITILDKFENNTNSAIAWLVPVNTSTSIFPEFVSPGQRLSASAVSALAASLANSLGSVWQNYDKTGSTKCCSFKSFIDFIKSPIGAPVFSYSMLLCFKTLGDFAPELPDNPAMLSLIGAIFAVSLSNGVLTHLGAKSEVNPLFKITRKDVANGMIAFISAAGFLAQIDRMLKMNMDPTTYETFGPYMLPAEAAIGLVCGVLRLIIPATVRSSNDKEDALLIMNKIKQNWDEINKHIRFTGNLIYISGLAIEANKLLDQEAATILISAILAGPVVATVIDKVTSCSKATTTSDLITSSAVNSPIFGKTENNINGTEEKEVNEYHVDML
ncbi:hypothetical protein [Legionella brunensis]|uniref:hypothetical protein n=1 Tax=Legionella brunensis TaxID=29422 RepID=UPI0010415A7F|nr:hypothetical protein [Legionella brunensis]